jgi:hypothetical protein
MKLVPSAVNLTIEKLEANRDSLKPHIFALLYDAKWKKFIGGVGSCRQCGQVGVDEFESMCRCPLVDRSFVTSMWFLSGF